MRVGLMAAMLVLLCACQPQPVTETPETATVETPIQVSGELVSVDSLGVSPPPVRRQWQYQIKYLAPEGKPIAKGELLVVLDASDLEQRLQLRQADLDEVQQDIETSTLRNEKQLQELKLQLAEAKMNQEKALRKYQIQDDSVAALERKKYRRDADIAEARVALIEQKLVLERQGVRQRLAMLEGDRQRWQAQVNQLSADIGRMTIVAPRAGMVVVGTSMEGAKLKPGASVYAGDDIVRLPDLSKMAVQLAIPEVEARRVNKGQKVKIKLDASPERPFYGQLTDISPVFRRKNQEVPVVVFDALATIDTPDPQLMRPGMTAKVEILP
ncbi:HlyD family secretion protein [Ferrimonas kyonanensis]|uniref:HlyD family secretion protein n=1 Tax=Ferrimonas kyonanensis TaxID=364763 RepID=UPI0009FB9C94|nr:HlyD family efflux transporter periplasmic adaptor subunit [Ferrimonas kyonanensis]